jgi:hypothetical protein
MKKLALILVTLSLCAVALASQAGASRPTPTTTLNATITGGQGWCCGTSVSFQGSGSIAGLGKTSFTGGYASGSLPSGGPFPFVRSLTLNLTTHKGALTLSSYVTWLPDDPQPPLTWTVTQATGRLAAYSGSGVYNVSVSGPSLTISLTGDLIR